MPFHCLSGLLRLSLLGAARIGRRTLGRPALLAILACSLGLTQQAAANSFSFVGNFAMDDNLRIFNFELLTTSTVTIRTYGYAGGTNAASQWLAGGGFDPVLSLFGGTSPLAPLLFSNNDGGCGLVGADAATGDCWDAYIQWSNLGPGTYSVVLSQYDNLPGGLLGDPFSQAGNGNFTGGAFGGFPGPFVDAHPAQRTSFYAVDILDVHSAADTSIPEPASIWLLGGGCFALLAGRRLRRR